MAATQSLSSAWHITALTKFRVPRLRRDTVSRPALLARLMHATETCPVTLICAPGGSGKSTLLAQFAHTCQHDADRDLLWVALDDEDDDRHQLLATLLRAVEPLNLVWDTPPQVLLAHAERSESQCRAALAAFVNALCTARSQRIVMVLDDLHCIERADAYELLESLIERLPDHVSFVFGTRVEPPLPLARWRGHGELAEFVPWDLRLTEQDAIALARNRLGADPDATSIRSALRRTHGWAAGFTMALQAHVSPSVLPFGSGAEAGERHLFAYLAQEVLADLPEALREFALRVSVLAELSPALCDKVTGRNDSKQILEALYRRNLFLTITDEATPVLRFHDLFRDFLQRELERRHPTIVRELHERAGRAEESLPRAIAHFLRSTRWDDAMELIAAHGEGMLASGDHSTLERWIDQIPEPARAGNAQIAYLRGVCAWLRWDWSRTKRELRPAIEGLTEPQYAALRIRAMFFEVDALNSSGENREAWELLDRIAREPLDVTARAQVALQRAFSVLSTGNPTRVAEYLQEYVALAERDPSAVCPQTADRIHCVCVGLPGVAECFERFFALAELIRGTTSAPWQLAALPVGAWAHFWRGRREPVQRLLDRGDTLHQQFGSMRLVADRLLQFRSLYLAAIDQFDAAETLAHSVIATLMLPETAAHRAVWLRAYQHGLARIYWMAGRYDQLRALAPTLLAPRVATEWEFLDAASELVRGQLAFLREDWEVAQASLESAVQLHERFRMPMIYGDPRLMLGYVHLKRGEPARCWECFAPVLDEVLNQESIGLLLLEPKRVVTELLNAVPSEMRRTRAFEALRARLAVWSTATIEIAPPVGPLAALSDRELEVLERVASGASNKHIARDLALSLHTVKRHIANILDKLDCASRGQAADLFRRGH